MTEQEKRKRRCCFTGHRPEKLNRPEAEIIAWLESEIRKAVDDGFVTFISGMARGVDIWAAEIVLRLRDEEFPIHLICASPFEGFERSWEESWRLRYAEVMRKADLVKYICKSYSRACISWTTLYPQAPLPFTVSITDLTVQAFSYNTALNEMG